MGGGVLSGRGERLLYPEPAVSITAGASLIPDRGLI